MVVAEIGVADGATTCFAIKPVYLNNGKYIAIDWFKGTVHPGWKSFNHLHSYRPDNDFYELFISNMKETGCFDCLETINKKSEDACSDIEDESLDICFIDADHSYNGVSRDIELYLPKVKRGGILCGHDYDDVNHTIADKVYTEEELAKDTTDVNGCSWHVGTIKAVYNKFGKLEVRTNIYGVPPIWIYRKP